MIWTLLKSSLIAFGISIFLSSCTVLSPVKTQTETTYVINTVPQPSTKKPMRRINLLVTPMEANPLCNTTDMTYTIRPYELDYFAKNRWAEPPAKMLQPLVLQILQKTRYFQSINSSAVIGSYDFILNTQLIQLQQHFLPHSSFVQLTLRAQLINAATNQVIATQQFSATEYTPQYGPYGGVIATNRAASLVLRQLANFCLKTIR